METFQTIDLTKTPEGVWRVGKTRIALDSVIYHFNNGATAEEIAQKFPALKLAEVYGVIAYYLSNRAEIDSYLREQETEADKLQTEIEAKNQSPVGELRERILARWESRQVALKP